MNIRTLLALAIVGCLLAGGLNAQEKKKLYRWVDKDGKVQISDQLPPEAVNQARKEINDKGVSTGTVDRALTDSERAAQVQSTTAQAEAQVVLDQQARVEAAMLVNYATEDDLRRTYKERIDLLQQMIESTDISIKSIRSSLIGMLALASESELLKQPVDPKRIGQIQEMHGELLKQQIAMLSNRKDVTVIEEEYKTVLDRYRELRSGAATPALPGAVTPTATPPAPAQTPAAQAN